MLDPNLVPGTLKGGTGNSTHTMLNTMLETET
jgi:hypothetical protein